MRSRHSATFCLAALMILAAASGALAESWVPSTRVIVGTSRIGPIIFASPTRTRIHDTQDWSRNLRAQQFSSRSRRRRYQRSGRRRHRWAGYRHRETPRPSPTPTPESTLVVLPPTASGWVLQTVRGGGR